MKKKTLQLCSVPAVGCEIPARDLKYISSLGRNLKVGGALKR